MAAWKEKRQLVGSRLVVLSRGQLVASVAFLCKRWRRSRSMVEPFLDLLVKDGMIKKSVKNNVSIITIRNYKKYQSEENENTDLDAYLSPDVHGESRKLDAHLDTHPDAYLDAYPERHFSEKTDAHPDAYLEPPAKSDRQKVCRIVEADSDAYLYADLDADLDAHPDATIKEVKNNNIDNDNNNAHARKEKAYVAELKGSQSWLELMAMNFQIGIGEVQEKIDEFALDQQCRGTKHRNINDVKRHFNDWLRIRLSKGKKDETVRQKFSDRRGASEITATSAEDYEGAF